MQCHSSNIWCQSPKKLQEPFPLFSGNVSWVDLLGWLLFLSISMIHSIISNIHEIQKLFIFLTGKTVLVLCISDLIPFMWQKRCKLRMIRKCIYTVLILTWYNRHLCKHWLPQVSWIFSGGQFSAEVTWTKALSNIFINYLQDSFIAETTEYAWRWKLSMPNDPNMHLRDYSWY